MEQIVTIRNTIITFRLNEDANCWQAKASIDGIETDIEIDMAFYNGTEVDWERFGRFYSLVNENNRFSKLIMDSQNLVAELGKAFYRRCYDEVSDFKMNFSNSIYYHGESDGEFTQDGYSFSLIFHYFAERKEGIFADDYGNYLVNVENLAIIGARRQQC